MNPWAGLTGTVAIPAFKGRSRVNCIAKPGDYEPVKQRKPKKVYVKRHGSVQRALDELLDGVSCRLTVPLLLEIFASKGIKGGEGQIREYLVRKVHAGEYESFKEDHQTIIYRRLK